MSLTRRSFLKRSLAAAATVTIAGTKSSGKVLGANDTIHIAVAGLNGRGGSHVGAWGRMKGVEITYLIDPDTRTYDKRLKQIADLGGKKPQVVKDVRKALEDKSLDAISIATPNHWHALMTIWGCQAGKDVYVEKPCSHNVHEGRIAVEAAKKYNRIVQHGTQSRSNGEMAPIVEVIKSGKLGKLLVSRGLCYKSGLGNSAPRAPPSATPNPASRRKSWTSTSGWGRRKSSPITTTWCITAGTGSGTSATATSVTRACMRWTRPAGPSPVLPCPGASSAWAAGSATRCRTRVKRRAARSPSLTTVRRN
jgi:hypothetical protein